MRFIVVAGLMLFALPLRAAEIARLKRTDDSEAIMQNGERISLVTVILRIVDEAKTDEMMIG